MRNKPLKHMRHLMSMRGSRFESGATLGVRSAGFIVQYYPKTYKVHPPPNAL